MKLYVPYTGRQMKLSTDTFIKRSFALKNHFRRLGFDIFSILEKLGFKLMKCAFCESYNEKFFLVTEIREGKIEITGLDYTYNGTHEPLYYCHSNRKCPGKRLNPNSLEFVAATKKLTKGDALTLIHSRNSTPFYRSNHDSPEAYMHYQKRDREWYLAKGFDPDVVFQKAEHSRSLAGLIENHGETEGKRIYSERCASKAITYENLSRKYGHEDALARIRNHRQATAQSLENFIARYGYTDGHLRYFSFICKSRISEMTNFSSVDHLVQYSIRVARACQDYGDFRLFGFPLMNVLLDKTIIRHAMRFFGLDEKELAKLVRQADPDIGSIDFSEANCRLATNKTIRCKMAYTPCGRLLRSSNEIRFHEKIKDKGWTFEIGKAYPESSLKYDFYFPDFSIYIEIAGLPDDPAYVQKMHYKEQTFGAWILWNEDDEDEAIERLAKWKLTTD